MQPEIERTLHTIYKELQHYNVEGASLLAGKAGVGLFNFLYLKHMNVQEGSDHFQQLIQELATDSLSYTDPAFCGGKSGINWFFTYLYSNDMLDQESHSLLCDDDTTLATKALMQMEYDLWDPLHGATGVAYYLSYKHNDTFDPFFKRYFEMLHLLIGKSTGSVSIPSYDLKTLKLVPGEVNIGLAHGIPGVLKLCVQCYRQGIYPAEAKSLAYKLSGFLLQHVNKDTSRSYFGNNIVLDSPGDKFSRLAWCYGDLGIAYMLYHAGVAFEDESLVNFATEVLLSSTQRRTNETTLVVDAGVCHGAAGIAHIYNKMWHHTGHPGFREAGDFWIQETLRSAAFKDGLAGFKKYTMTDDKNGYFSCPDIIEGVAGIGLVLLSYLKKDFSWDYCMFLNE